MVKHKSVSAEERDVYSFENTLTTLYNFHLRHHWSMSSSILSFQLRVKSMQIYDLSTIKIWPRNVVPSFLQYYRSIHTALCSLLRICWIHCAQFFLFPQATIDIADILLQKFCLLQQLLFMEYCASTEEWIHLFRATCVNHCWNSTSRSIISVSSQPFLVSFACWWTVSYKEKCAPKPSFNYI